MVYANCWLKSREADRMTTSHELLMLCIISVMLYFRGIFAETPESQSLGHPLPPLPVCAISVMQTAKSHPRLHNFRHAGIRPLAARPNAPVDPHQNRFEWALIGN